MERITYCADVIAVHKPSNEIVLVERMPATLDSVRGFALPGGKQSIGEILSHTATRELREETGLRFELEGALSTYAEAGRDPRGRYISTVFYGTATGRPRREIDNGLVKTRVVLLDRSELARMVSLEPHRFAFDHADIIEQYLGHVAPKKCR
jgi:ADP-ribose pyrophosphatase YjhB (NUDIX family)